MREADTYASFADGDGFRGVVVAPVDDLDEALAVINAAGLNPGGQVALWRVPVNDYPTMRLLSRADLAGHESYGEMSERARTEAEAAAAIVCEECNS